jgi:hypothetical protein
MLKNFITKNKISNRQIRAIETYFEINNLKGLLVFNEKTSDWLFRPHGKVPFRLNIETKLFLKTYDRIAYRQFPLVEAELKELGVTFDIIPLTLRLALRYKTGRR